MSGSTAYRLNCSRDTVEASKYSKYLSQEALTFKEVDFSECSLTNDTLKVVINICNRCPRLRILKLYKNQLDDRAVDGLVEMVRKTPGLEELHLSHNLFTAQGCRRLVEAGESFSWDEKSQPLWLRLEQNSVADPEKVVQELEEEFSVCKRSDTVNCTVRNCVNKKKVHLPFFHLQRPIFRSRAEQAAEAKAKQAPPVPTRKLSDAPKVARPSAWGKGARAPDDSPGPKGYGAEEPKVLPAKSEALPKPIWKEGSRPSVVLDSFAQRRTMPDQLDGVDPTPFVCCMCHFVMTRPLITRCSHIFCARCFKQWVETQVAVQKREGEKAGATVQVPQIRCPHPGCEKFLKKTDVEPADDGKTSGTQLFQRLRNNLVIRCVHHPDHYKLDFGKDAFRVFEEKGLSCSWSGGAAAYEEHMSQCAVENFLKSEGDATINSEGTRSHYEAEPEPEDSVTTEPKAEGGTVNVNPNESEVRIALYDYTPAEGEQAQIPIKANDHIKVFEVSDKGWAAGVRICKKTRQEIGETGWFPASYLQPTGVQAE